MNDFYVYAWLRPCGTPFYIGKGRNRRDAAPKVHNPLFLRVADKMRRGGENPVVVRIADGLSEAEAFDVERAQISLYGRRDNKTGILANLTDGGEGRSGSIPSAEVRRKIGDAHRGTKRPASTGRKISASKLGKPRPSHVGDAVRAAKLGVRLTADALEKRIASVRLAGPYKNNSSGYKGVTPKRERWSAYIDLPDGRQMLGTFPTPEAAARAYDKAAYAAWGNSCYLNFPAEAA